MARQYGRILTSVWSDPDFKELDGESQRVYFLILSQPELTMCGTLTPAVARWSTMSKNGSIRSIKASLLTLAHAAYLVTDDTTDELWVRTFAHHDLNLKIPNVWVGMSNAFVTIASERVRTQFLVELRKAFPQGFPPVVDEGCVDRLAKGFLKGFLYT